MTKNGKVEIVKTPSTVSGKPADVIKDGEPLRFGEKVKDPGLRKLASKIQSK